MQNNLLSEDERRIASLLLDGLSYRQIARNVGRSHRWVRKFTKRLYDRVVGGPAIKYVDGEVNGLRAFLEHRFREASRGESGKALAGLLSNLQIPAQAPPRRSGKIRINELARELEVKSNLVLDYLAELGIPDKKSHSSALDDDLADKVRRHFLSEQENKPTGGAGSEYLGVALVDGRFRLVAMLPDGSYRYLDSLGRLNDLIYTISSETVELQRAIETLEDLLNSSASKEGDFQQFFEENPDFIASDEHIEARADVYLTREGEETLKPDFVLRPIDPGRTSDLLELKLPSVPVYVGRTRRQRLSQAVMEARAQLMEYARYFDDPTNRKFIKGKYDIFVYRPRMFVVIGRRGTVSPIIRRKAELTADDLRVITYDDIVDKMNRKLAAMKRGQWRQLRSG